MTLNGLTFYPSCKICDEVEYPFSPISQQYFIVEYLKDNYEMHGVSIPLQ